MGYHADRPRCRTEGREIWGKTLLITVEKYGVRKIHDSKNYARNYDMSLILREEEFKNHAQYTEIIIALVIFNHPVLDSEGTDTMRNSLHKTKFHP
jgi:hypothetical protein